MRVLCCYTIIYSIKLFCVAIVTDNKDNKVSKKLYRITKKSQNCNCFFQNDRNSTITGYFSTNAIDLLIKNLLHCKRYYHSKS